MTTPAQVPNAESFNPQNVPRDVAALVAREIHESNLLSLARARILTAARHGLIDPEQSQIAQQLADWYEEQSPFQRARYIADVMGPYWTAAQNSAFWFAQAEQMLDLEAYPDVINALQQLPASIDIQAQERRESLLGLTLLLQSKIPEAIQALERRQGFPHQRRIDHFNFAVAMTAHKRKLEGLALLDELAEMPAANPDDMAVGDRASNALGWIWLKEAQGGSARASFKRVNLEGPYSNMALLGLGWAELVPAGEAQKIEFRRELSCGDVQNAPDEARLLLFNSYRVCRKSNKYSVFTYYRSFAFEPGEAGKKRFAKALVWWRELASREITDPAVQEAWLAAAYAQSQLDNAQAIPAYEAAITRYESEISRLVELEQQVRRPGANPEALLANDKHPQQFSELRTSRRYRMLTSKQQLVKQSAVELSAIRSWVETEIPRDESGQNLVEHVREQWTRQKGKALDTRSQVAAELSELVATEILQVRTRLERYRTDAVWGLARLYDRQAQP